MKKTTLLHSELSHLISTLGHTDKIVIADAGLPIPKEVVRIDLALRAGIPGFMVTLETILSEMCVEKAWVAQEMAVRNAGVHEQLPRLLGHTPLEVVPHDHFKTMMKSGVTAVIRTGEYSPYANIMLQSGVMF